MRGALNSPVQTFDVPTPRVLHENNKRLGSISKLEQVFARYEPS